VGTSIGYESRDEGKPTDGEKARYAKYGKSLMSVLRKWNWIEQTITAMPCNPDAQSIPEIDSGKAAVIDGLLTKGHIKAASAKLFGFPVKEKRKIVLKV
jgi:hypothetical protein